MDFCLDYRFMTEQKLWTKLKQRQIARREGLSAPEAWKVYEQRAAATWRLAQRATGMSRPELDKVVAQIVKRVENMCLP